MKTHEYQKSELNLTKDIKAYKDILETSMDFFIDLKVIAEDKTTLTVEYNTDGLVSFIDFMDSDTATKYRLGISLIDLINKKTNHFQVNLNPNNLFVSESLKVYVLDRIFKQDREIDKDLNDIKALVGSLILKQDFSKVIGSENKLLKKDSNLIDVYKATTLEQLKEIFTQKVEEIEVDTNVNKVLVPKKYYKKNKRLKILLWIIVLILVAILVFLAAFYIPNRNTQLVAYEDFQAGVYEDVVADLSHTNIGAMTPLSKYIMSVSTIKLSDFSDSQQENILKNLSPETEVGELDFWVYMGQGDHQRAYDQALQNNDAQQKAYALMILIEDTKNDTKMSEEDKQEKIGEYQKELESTNEVIHGK